MSARRICLFVLSLAVTIVLWGAGVASASIDDRFAAVAREAPAFGGMFVDEKANLLYIYLTDQRAQASAEKALRDAFADERLPSRVRVLPGRYGFGRLKAWHERLDALVLSVPGVVLTDVDDQQNRLTVGVDGQKAEARVESLVALSEIPREAVSIERMAPFKDQSTLRARRRPLVGGIQITFIRGTAQKACTLGWNALRAGVHGFVTASHCTRTPGANPVEGTVYHQPSASGTANQVGVETVDPAYFAGGVCPATQTCRFSDAAFARLDSGEPGVPVRASQGIIARDTDDPANPVEWNGVNVYRIVGKADAVVGDGVRKIGRTTGTTVGTVTRVCVSSPRAGAQTALCQTAADYASAGGDSGAPVISRHIGSHHQEATLRGIHSARTADGKEAIYSPISAVEAAGELGPMTDCVPGAGC